jgi:AraC-like DNA-binding protein
MLCMLQDRRRPLWPIAAMMTPLVVVVLAYMVTRSYDYLPWLHGYFLLTVLGFTIYMACAVRQYGRWLRDNYADLEHKEVWQSFVVLAVIILIIGYYVVGYGGKAYEYIVQMFGLALIGYLLWRVETLSDLSIVLSVPIAMEEETAPIEDMEEKVPSQTSYDFIAPLLQQYCVDTKLYLQHDLSVVQLAKKIGTNRLYLSQYFSSQGTTYNAYINDLRISHFVKLYREAAADKRNVTAQQLANGCGYRSYSTFTLAFKQRMGQSVTAWMREMD